MCSTSSEDCSHTACCRDPGFKCYKKDDYFAGCRKTCTPGIHTHDPVEFRTPWTCELVDKRQPTNVTIFDEDTDGPAQGPLQSHKAEFVAGGMALVLPTLILLGFARRLCGMRLFRKPQKPAEEQPPAEEQALMPVV